MRLIDVQILFVNTDRNCFDAVTLDGISNFKDIKYITTGMKQSGDIYHPEIGDIARIEVDPAGQAILKEFYSTTWRNQDNQTEYRAGEVNFPDSALPGDRKISGPDGAYLSLDRGKRARVAGGPLAQSVYFGLEGLIRTICQNYEAFGSGFRVFSVNTDGKITTRLCFSSSDVYVAKGVNENEDAVSENFEYQIDINEDGMTLFVGKIDETTGKRKNNFTTSINRDGDLIGTCGDNIQFAMYSDGGIVKKIFDDSNRLLYSHSVSMGTEKVLVKEIIEGNVVRLINGNIYENVTGQRKITTDKNIISANINDLSTVVNRKSAALNNTELATAKFVNPIQR